MEAIIRPATLADLPAIVAMRDTLNTHELAGSPHAPIQRLTVEQFAEFWSASFSDPQHCWRIVEVDGAHVGFGLIYMLAKTNLPGAFLHWAYVDQAHRRLGLGQCLFEHLAAWARRQGATRIELQYIDNNHIAENFWTKLGFESYAHKCVQYL